MTAGGPLLFALSSGLLSILALRWAGRLLPEARAARRLLATVLLFVAAADLLLLGLGTFGWLNAWSPTVAVAVLFAIDALLAGRGPSAPVSSASRDSRVTTGSRAPAASERIAAVAGALLVGLLAWWGARTLAAGTGFVWDDLAYHAVLPAWWVVHGAIELVPLNYQGYYPANAELFSLWFVLPLGADALANTVVFVWMLLVVSAFAAMAEEHGASGLVTAAVAACFLASPELGFFTGTFSANDLGVAGLGTAMLALAWSRDASAERAPERRALLCGIAAGLLLGTKVSAAPQIALVTLWWCSRRYGGGVGWRGLAAFGAGLVTFGSYWYARNWILTGNPVFPAQLGPFDGPLAAEAARKTTLLPTIAAGWNSPGFWIDFLRRRLDWPVPLGLVTLAGYGLGVLGIFRAEAHKRRHLLLLTGAGLLFLLLFPLQPFSGTNNRPGSGLHDLIRYLSWPFALGLLTFALALPRGRRWEIAASVVVLLALGFSAPERDGLLWFPIGALAAFALARCSPLRVPTLGVAAAVLGFFALALGVDAKQRATAQRLYQFDQDSFDSSSKPRGRTVGPTWRALEELPDGSRLALISHDPASHALAHPLFGRRLQHQLIGVYRDGRARGPLHETWRDEPEGWWWEFGELRRAPKGEELLANLRASGVEYVVLSKWPQNQPAAPAAWPKARAALRGVLSEDARVHADDYGEIWFLGAKYGTR